MNSNKNQIEQGQKCTTKATVKIKAKQMDIGNFKITTTK